MLSLRHWACCQHAVSACLGVRFLTGWKRDKFIRYLLDLQAPASTNMASILFPEPYFRIDPGIGLWELDDTKHLATLKALASRDVARYATDIRQFIRCRNTAVHLDS